MKYGTNKTNNGFWWIYKTNYDDTTWLPKMYKLKYNKFNIIIKHLNYIQWNPLKTKFRGQEKIFIVSEFHANRM